MGEGNGPATWTPAGPLPRSPMDWMRLQKTSKDLSGTGGATKKHITLEELAQHSTPDDAWMAIRGKVYHITPYLKFHPGGAKILVAYAGKDATKAFNKYHAWVNVDFLLGRALVGMLEVPDGEETDKGRGREVPPVPAFEG